MNEKVTRRPGPLLAAIVTTAASAAAQDECKLSGCERTNFAQKDKFWKQELHSEDVGAVSPKSA